MARELICDICRKPTEEIVGKLFYSALSEGRRSKNNFHANYTHHCDVGACCQDRLLAGFNFRERKTAAEYQAARRKSTTKKKAA